MCQTIKRTLGVGKLGRSKVGLGKLGLGKLGIGKVGRWGGKLGRGPRPSLPTPRVRLIV